MWLSQRCVKSSIYPHATPSKLNVLAACFMMVSFLVYSSTLKMHTTYYSETLAVLKRTTMLKLLLVYLSRSVEVSESVSGSKNEVRGDIICLGVNLISFIASLIQEEKKEYSNLRSPFRYHI